MYLILLWNVTELGSIVSFLKPNREQYVQYWAIEVQISDRAFSKHQQLYRIEPEFCMKFYRKIIYI